VGGRSVASKEEVANCKSMRLRRDDGWTKKWDGKGISKGEERRGWKTAGTSTVREQEANPDKGTTSKNSRIHRIHRVLLVGGKECCWVGMRRRRVSRNSTGCEARTVR